jgi:hypothetical protein
MKYKNVYGEEISEEEVINYFEQVDHCKDLILDVGRQEPEETETLEQMKLVIYALYDELDKIEIVKE